MDRSNCKWRIFSYLYCPKLEINQLMDFIDFLFRPSKVEIDCVEHAEGQINISFRNFDKESYPLYSSFIQKCQTPLIYYIKPLDRKIVITPKPEYKNEIEDMKKCRENYLKEVQHDIARFIEMMKNKGTHVNVSTTHDIPEQFRDKTEWYSSEIKENYEQLYAIVNIYKSYPIYEILTAGEKGERIIDRVGQKTEKLN